MPLRIAEQLSPIYRELVDGALVSSTLNTPVHDAPARSHCQRLIIVELEDDHLLVRSWSFVDEIGLHHDVPCPIPGERIITEEFASANPHIRYSICDHKITMIVRLGRSWLRAFVGPVTAEGSFDASGLTLFRSYT